MISKIYSAQLSLKSQLDYNMRITEINASKLWSI